MSAPTVSKIRSPSSTGRHTNPGSNGLLDGLRALRMALELQVCPPECG